MSKGPASDAPSVGRSRRRGPRWLLAGPSTLWYGLFFVAPIALIVVYSFGLKDTTSTSGVPVDLGSPTLANYRTAFSDTFMTVFTASMRIAVIATAACVVIGFPVAYFMAFKLRERWRAAMLALIVVPSFASFLLRTVAWRIPLSANGHVSVWLQDIGLRDTPLNVLDNRIAVQIAIVYNYLGFMILPLYVALDRIESAMRDVSKDLGANRWRTLFQVTIPLASPGIAAGIMLTFIPMCGDYLTAAVLGGSDGFMVGSLIESQFRQAQDWPLGSAMAVLLIAAVLLVLAIAGLLIAVLRGVLRARRRVRLVPIGAST